MESNKVKTVRNKLSTTKAQTLFFDGVDIIQVEP